MYDSVIINGVEYASENDSDVLDLGAFIVHGTIDVNDTIETSKEASFTMRQAGEYTNIYKFMTVEIKRLGVRIFGGFVWSVSSKINARSGVRDLVIKCTGNEYIAKKAKPIGRAYTSASFPTLDLVVTDIYNSSLSVEGISIGLIEGSDIEVGQFTFNYLSPYDCLDLICERTNMIWYIDENKNLFFISRGTLVSSASLTWQDRLINYETLNVTRLNDKYRNVQYSIGGRIKTSTLEEIQAGDGSKTTFVMPYAIAETPVVYVDRGSGYLQETVELKTDDLSGAAWFWEYGSTEIIQGSSQTTLLSSDLIKVEFIGLVSAVIISRNEAEVYDKAQLDGTSGEVVNVESIDLDGLDAIRELADDRLDTYAVDSYEVEFETCRGGLRAGMTMQGTNIPEEFIEDDLLISEISISQRGNVLVYKVKAVFGPLNDSWVTFFTQVNERKTESQVSGQTVETVTQVLTYSKTWLETEDPNLFQTELTIPFTVTATFGFSGLTRSRYLAWYDSVGTELGRTKILIENYDDQDNPTEISSIAWIPASVEASIRYLGWIGGQSATIETDTGYILDQQSVVLDKTNLDIYQVEKTDYKWA